MFLPQDRGKAQGSPRRVVVSVPKDAQPRELLGSPENCLPRRKSGTFPGQSTTFTVAKGPIQACRAFAGAERTEPGQQGQAVRDFFHKRKALRLPALLPLLHGGMRDMTARLRSTPWPKWQPGSCSCFSGTSCQGHAASPTPAACAFWPAPEEHPREAERVAVCCRGTGRRRASSAARVMPGKGR